LNDCRSKTARINIYIINLKFLDTSEIKLLFEREIPRTQIGIHGVDLLGLIEERTHPIIQEPTQSFKNPPNHSRTHPIIQEPTQSFKNPPNHQIIQEPTKSFKNPPNHSRTHQIIQEPTKSFKNPPNHSRTHQIIQEPTKSFKNPPNHSRTHQRELVICQEKHYTKTRGFNFLKFKTNWY